jgi:acetylornithine deacetylase/succinyl-diaminopimelate desuccinylase-like protein
MSDVISYIERNSDRYLQELMEFLRLPSISTNVGDPEEVKRTAQFVADQLKHSGMSTVQVFPTGGHPIVYAERIEDPSKPTVLIYGHYDVQPVDPIELWDSPPFDPVVRNGKIFARGSTDDKGQMMIHFKSTEAFVETRGRLPLNIKFLIEGEEEIGSAHLDEFIREQQDQLQCDAVVISDTALFAKGVPSICYGLRGMAYLEIEVRGPKGDLHSGSFGGPVGNPAFALVTILASMKDEKDRITIPGFYDRVRELTEAERQGFASLPFDLETYKQDLGVKALAGEVGFTPLEQVWARPTLEINGLLSGFTGEGAKTVLPAKAMAKVSMRLVPDQDHEEIAKAFQEYVLSVAPEWVDVEVRDLHGGAAWVAELDHPALVAAANAIEKGFGKRPVFQREGGSIPVVATFTELLKAPTVLMGIGLPDENAHAPNEHLDLENFFAGIKSSAFFLESFAEMGG